MLGLTQTESGSETGTSGTTAIAGIQTSAFCAYRSMRRASLHYNRIESIMMW